MDGWMLFFLSSADSSRDQVQFGTSILGVSMRRLTSHFRAAPETITTTTRMMMITLTLTMMTLELVNGGGRSSPNFGNSYVELMKDVEGGTFECLGSKKMVNELKRSKHVTGSFQLRQDPTNFYHLLLPTFHTADIHA